MPDVQKLIVLANAEISHEKGVTTLRVFPVQITLPPGTVIEKLPKTEFVISRSIPLRTDPNRS